MPCWCSHLDPVESLVFTLFVRSGCLKRKKIKTTMDNPNAKYFLFKSGLSCMKVKM